MQTTVLRRNSAHPADLTDELVRAEQKYRATRASVIDRATARQESIAQIQSDLAAEQTQLQEVVDAARK